jgi:hypothetical protein
LDDGDGAREVVEVVMVDELIDGVSLRAARMEPSTGRMTTMPVRVPGG